MGCGASTPGGGIGSYDMASPEFAALSVQRAGASAGANMREQYMANKDVPDPKLLLQAASAGDIHTVRRLLDAGAVVDAKGPDKVSPLVVACSKGHAHVGRVLLERGANPHTRDTRGASLLLVACANGDKMMPVVEELCMARVPLWPMPTAVRSPAWSRAAGLSSADTSDENLPTHTPLSVAAENGSCAILRRLLRAGALARPPDPGPKTRWTRGRWAQACNHTLCCATAQGELEAMRLLCSHNIAPDGRDFGHRRPLYHAVQHGQVPAAELLLSLGANVAHEVHSGSNALHVAAAAGREELGRLLIKAALTTPVDPDADPAQSGGQATGSNGAGVFNLVRLVRGRDKKGRFAADVAKENGRTRFAEMIDAFEKPPPPRSDPALAAIKAYASFLVQGSTLQLPQQTLCAMVGSATHTCWAALPDKDSVVKMIAQAGYDPSAKPWGCEHGMFVSCGIADDSDTAPDGPRAVQMHSLAERLQQALADEAFLRSQNEKFYDGIPADAVAPDVASPS